MEFTDCCFMFDNEALYDICTRSLDVEKPTYGSINRLIAQVEYKNFKPAWNSVKAIASTTASLRFNGDLDIDLHEVKKNLVPFPRLHFPIISYAPFLSRERAGHKSYSVQELTNACFNRDNQMIKYEADPQNTPFKKYIDQYYKEQYSRAERYISCCLLYRGDVAPTNVHSSIETIKQQKLGYFTRYKLFHRILQHDLESRLLINRKRIILFVDWLIGCPRRASVIYVLNPNVDFGVGDFVIVIEERCWWQNHYIGDVFGIWFLQCI